jgi:hypothetical protein
MLVDNMTGVSIDKCTENFSIRVPEVLKGKLDNLSKPQKAELKQRVMYLMARYLHENNFNPELYLSTQDL